MIKEDIKEMKILQKQYNYRVCAGCGHKIKVRRFEEMHGSQKSVNYFPVCTRCSKIEYGVSKRIYDISVKFVKGYNFRMKHLVIFYLLVFLFSFLMELSNVKAREPIYYITYPTPTLKPMMMQIHSDNYKLDIYELK